MKILCSLLGVLVFIAAVSASRADEVSDEIAQKKDAEARAAESRKQANSAKVPDDVLKKLDYRDWRCSERIDKTIRQTIISGRVTEIYFGPSSLVRNRPPKVAVKSFVVESKSGEATEIYFDPGMQGVSVSTRDNKEDRKYLDLLLKKIRH